VAHDRAAARICQFARPRNGGRWRKRANGVVVAAKQPADACQCFICQRPSRIGRDRNVSLDPLERLSTLVITTVRHRRWEALGHEVLKQKRDGRRLITDGSPDGVSDAPDFTSVSHSSCQRFLRHLRELRIARRYLPSG